MIAAVSLNSPPAMKTKLFSIGASFPSIIVIVFGISSSGVSQAQTSTWTNDSGGLFSNAANWDNGSPNGPGFNAIIDDGDSAVAVTLDGSRTINHLTIGADDSLLFQNNITLTVAGNVTNDGLIQLNSVGNSTLLSFSGVGVQTLGGSGIFRLGGNSANGIGGTGTVANSATHTIEGAGNIGRNTLGIVNNGLIRANISGTTMTIDPSAVGGLVNSGTIRAENGGSLVFTGNGGGLFDNDGGTIAALDGTSVRFNNNASITGGTLTSVGSGALFVDPSQTVSFGDLTQSGDLIIGNNSDLRLSGNIVNSGSISTNSVGNGTNLRIESGGINLSGGGSINFQDGAAGINGGTSGSRITNVDNLIRGFGGIGQNSAAITNEASGVIQADVSGQSLVLDPVATATDGNDSFINDGILRASQGGQLVLTGNSGGNFTNNNLIEALDLSTVLLTKGASITGGTLATSGSGEFVVDASQNAFLTDLSNTGTIVARNNSDLGISGSIQNSGLIRLTTVGNSTDLEIQGGGATISGGGIVSLEGNGARINSLVSGTRFTNTDNIIHGFGSIGVDNTAITNAAGGLIHANGGGTLILNPVAESSIIDLGASFVNDGILRASNGGTLQFTGSGGGNFTNNHRIEALDGSIIELITNARITGGTLATSGTGEIRGRANQNFDIANLTLAGNLITENNSDLGVTGTINNTGSITITQVGNDSDIEVQAGGVIFTGGGSINFTSSTASGLNTNASGARFTNVDNILQGTASIGRGVTAITNGADGLIDANVSGKSIILDPTATATDGGAGFLNDGMLRASNGGTLVFTGSGGGDFTNNNLIEALAGSFVDLTSGARISGGRLSTTDDGLFRVLSNQNIFLEDLSNEGNIIAQNNSDVGISGVIQNSGSITLTSLGNHTDLEVQSVVAVLQGGGTITLSDYATGIDTAVSGNRLINSDNTIQGRGFFGQNVLAITNGPEATIDANLAGNTLLIDPVATATDGDPSFFNRGIVQASNGGTLSLTGSGGGTFTNATGGTFAALDGSTLNMISGAVLTNNAGGILTGGRYIAEDTGNGASLSLLGAAVTKIEADTLVDLSGSNSAITFSGTALSQSLTENAGTLRLRSGRVFNNANDLINSGSLELEGGTFAAPSLLNSGTIKGFGNLNVRPENSANIIAAGGTLVFSNGISDTAPSSSITVNSAAALDISGGSLASSTASLAHNGTDLNLGSNDITVSSDYTNASFGTGNAFNARANVSGSGLILASGNTTQAITGAASGGSLDFGNVHVGDSHTLHFQIANTGTSGPALRGAIQTSANGGNITDSRISGAGASAGNFGPIATGTDSGNLGVTYTASNAGALIGQSIHIENNFDNVSGTDIAITGAAYRLAAPGLASSTVDFGIIHVGDSVSQNLTLSNNAPADDFSEKLNASFSSSGASINASGAVSGLVAGASNSSSLSVSVDTSSAQFIGGNTTLAFMSDGAGTSGLGSTALAGGQVAVSAQVNNYALPSFQLQSGAATLIQDSATSFTLDFGTLLQASGSSNSVLAVTNDVSGPADTLAGSFDLASIPGFTAGGFFDFEDLEAGDSQSGLLVTFDTSNVGTFNGDVYLDARSQNASGYDGVLDRVTLSFRGIVVVPEPSSSALLAIALCGLVLRRKR